MTAHFRDGRWQGLDAATAMELSGYFQARGRYELAQGLHAIGTEWYEREVLSKMLPGDTNGEGKPFTQILEEYKQRLAEFPLLLVTRSRLLESLNGLAEEIYRDKLKTLVKHEGSTAFGVVCNQLVRGGWIRQEKTGKKYTIYPEGTAPVSDELFASTEMNRRAEANRLAAEIQHDPDYYEVIEAEPIPRKPMTPELQQILDDARQAGYFVQDDHANDGLILIRPYFEYELFLAEHPEENLVHEPIPLPCGTALIWKPENNSLPKGLTIWPDHMAHRMDVKPGSAEDITDYAVMLARFWGSNPDPRPSQRVPDKQLPKLPGGER